MNPKQSDHPVNRSSWLKNFADTLTDPAVMFDPDGKLLFINQSFTDVFGWTHAELAERPDSFVPEELKEETRQALATLPADAQPNAIETSRLCKTGETKEVSWCPSLCLGSNGKVLGHLEVFRDLSHELKGRRVLQTLLEVATELPNHPQLDDLLQFIGDRIKTLLDAESSSVMLLDEGRQELFFRVVRPPEESMGERFKELRFPADQGVAGHVVQTGKALHVPDLGKDPRFYDAVDKHTGFVSRNLVYAPLWVDDKVTGVLGALNKRHGTFHQDDVDFMVMLSHTVALAVENARVNQKRWQAERRLRESLREKEALLLEIHHRVKNNMQVVASILSLEGERIEDPAAKAAFQESQDRIRALALVHETVYQSGDLSTIHLNEYTSTLCNALFTAHGGGHDTVGMVVDTEPLVFGLDQAVPFGLVLNELVTNSFKHAFPNGRRGQVRVSVHSDSEGLVEMIVTDDGVGADAEDLAGKSGAGLVLTRGLVEQQLRGSIEFDVADGLKVTVRFRPKPPRAVDQDV